MAQRFTDNRPQYMEVTGEPIIGSLGFYVTGTTTPITTYSNKEATTANTNPVNADSNGRFPQIWFTDAASDAGIKAVLFDAINGGGSVVFTDDPISYNAATGQLVLTSSQAAEPYANTFIRFKQPDGVTKAVIGFTETGDNTLSISSYEDFRLKFKTGKVGDPTATTNRAVIHGDATSGWVGIVSANSATELGGCYLKFTESDDSNPKGFVGFYSTVDNDMDIRNVVSGGHIELATTGAGRVRMSLTSGTALLPYLTPTGDPDTGLYSGGDNSLTAAVGGVANLTLAVGSNTSLVALRALNGGPTVPAYSFTTSTGAGFYLISADTIGVATAFALMFTFNSTGSVNFKALAVAPASPTDGDVYYDSALVKLRVRAGGAWVNLH